jgi:glycosyltransferase involved in cell wall biosynthesis
MKIWLLTSETPLYNPGGIARYIDNFARYLAAEGHEITVFGRDDECRDQVIVPGYTYKSVVHKWNLCGEKADSPDPDKHPSFPYNLLDYWGAFSYQMADVVLEHMEASGSPDVIESQEYCAVPYYLLQRKLTGTGPLASVPIVVNAHSPDFITREHNQEPRYKLPHYWTGRLEMYCLHAADAVICPSGFLSQELEERFGKSITVEHYPLPWTDPSTFDEAVSVEEGTALYFGRLEIRKGVLRLVEEADRLWSEGADFKLKLIGGDTQYFPRNCTVGEWIQHKFKKWIDTGKLIIQTALPQAELMQEVKAAAFTLIPSLWENWPNTCIEAMSLGKVVVGSENGGQAEMIGDDEACGFVFSWDDTDGLAGALRKAISLDAIQREEMGAVARERIATLCRPELVLQQRLEHFNKVIKSAAPRRSFPFVNRRLRDSTKSQLPLGKEEQKDLVSVIIPHYNMGQFVEATVTSAINIDWPDVEIILVDDGSSDPQSIELLERLEEEHQGKVKVHRKSNGGLASARNAGVAAAKGELILLLDADDQVEPEFVRRAIGSLRRYDNVHVVYSWERYFDASHDIYPCWNFEFPYLLGHNMTCPISVLYRQTYLDVGGSKEKMAYNFEDFELWINMAEQGYGGISIAEPLSLYRIRMDGMWQGSSRDQHLYLQDLITEIHPDLYKEYGGVLFNLQNANGSAQKWVKPAAESPFDEFEQWSRRRIANLEKETKKWWERSVAAEKRLQASEVEKNEIWQEKVRMEKETRTGEKRDPS